MTSNFEGMKECSFCESGTFEPVEVFYEKTGHVIYCRRCWKEFGDSQLVDNSGDTPK